MKNLRLIAASIIFAAIFSVSAFAQTTAGNKVFVIDTGAFVDEKEGITKFINAAKKLKSEMQSKSTELEAIAKKIQDSAKQFGTLRTEYEKNPNGPIPAASVQQKGDEIEKMQIEYKRKEEDLKQSIAKREQELFNPLRADIYKSMNAFAKEKSYPIILDLVRLVEINLILVIGDEKVDLTKEFIQYYNSRPNK